MRNPKYERLTLVFFNSRLKRRRSLEFIVHDHALAQRWAKMLAYVLKSGLHLEKTFLLHGWPSTRRDLKFLCAGLNRNIEIINKFFATQAKPYHIDLFFDAATVGQDELNRIHHHFELLIGQVWDVSPYYRAASPPVRQAIRELNNLCHEMENWIRSAESRQRGACASQIFTAFMMAPRTKMQTADYEHFSLNVDFGDVVLHYAQLGKTHLEAFTDHDEEIHDQNISGLRYVSGEFDIFFGEDSKQGDDPGFQKEFRAWMTRSGFDPDDKTLGIGFAKVASLDRAQFADSPTNFEVMEQLFEYDDVTEIRLKTSDGVVLREFPKSWEYDGEIKERVFKRSRWTRMKQRLTLPLHLLLS